MQSTANVIIVGGGVIGLSIAYHLAQKGFREVLVLERELAPIMHSSGRSASGIRLQFSSDVNIRLSQYSLERLKHFEEEMGVPSDLRQVGYLFLLNEPEAWQAFQTQTLLQRSLGVPTELLTPAEIGQRFPWVAGDDLLGASFCPEDGYADAYSVARGYEQQARALGVRILTETTVTAVLTQAGHVSGVETNRGHISAPVVVNAAGAWAGELGRLAGVEVPVKPYRRQIFTTTPFHGLPEEIPLTIDVATSSYCRREGDRVLMGMSDKSEPSSFRTNTDDQFLVKLLEALTRRIPVLEEANIHRGFAGLYEVSPDHNAILGSHPDLEGLFLANGFSGHGFQQAPAVGRVLAELIAGEPPLIDVSSLGLERFRRGTENREHMVV